jgi:hypothetical protein
MAGGGGGAGASTSGQSAPELVQAKQAMVETVLHHQ